MKKIITLLAFIFTTLSANEYKVVFDCSSHDASFVKSRMWLIGKTIDMMKENGDNLKVALTLHGGCVPMVSKDFEMIVPDEDIKDVKKAQEYLIDLSKRKNVKIIACAMSLSANAIDKSEVLPFINISENSFIDTIKYQNSGYALMSFK
jgi:intracellular sulfur oxidation DsrE/DsrF family protein